MNDKGNLKIECGKLIKHENKAYCFKELVNFYLKSYEKINHKVYRKIVKKVQRKYFRQANAQLLNDLENKYQRIESRPCEKNEFDPSQSEINEESSEEEKAKKEKEHNLWVERERLAQIEWKAKKEKEERENLKKSSNANKEKSSFAKRNSLIPLDYHQSPKSHKNVLETPSNSVITFTMDDIQREKCQYFLKTGVCKYGNYCNKTHIYEFRPNEQLTTLIIPNMYTNMLLGYELLQLNNDSDEMLEYEESDIIDHFNTFYNDVLSELKKYGHLMKFLVCSNYEPHLRGNVYIQYAREEEAKEAYTNLNGRFYGGKQIFCYYSHVKNWRDAVCSQFLRNQCSKGKKCKYLHVFKNPSDEFSVFKNSKYENLSRSSKNTKSSKEEIRVSDKWSSDEEESKKQRDDQWEKDFVHVKDQNPRETSARENGDKRKRKHSKRIDQSPSPVQGKHHKKRKSHHNHNHHRHRHRHSK